LWVLHCRSEELRLTEKFFLYSLKKVVFLLLLINKKGNRLPFQQLKKLFEPFKQISEG
jgi:hypothetical protein